MNPTTSRPHGFRIVWTRAGQPGRHSTPVTVLGARLDHEDARGIIAGTIQLPAAAVTVEDVVPRGPIRGLHPDTDPKTGEDTGAPDVAAVLAEQDAADAAGMVGPMDPAQAEYARTCPDCRSLPGRPCRSWTNGSALHYSHRARRT